MSLKIKKLTHQIIEIAQENLGVLNENSEKMLEEHIEFAIERLRMGLTIEKNREDELISISEKAPFVYYVHSYYAQDYNDEDLVGFSYYGSLKIPGLVRRKNVMGAQFHPEKSGEAGLNILRNFKELI